MEPCFTQGSGLIVSSVRQKGIPYVNFVMTYPGMTVYTT